MLLLLRLLLREGRRKGGRGARCLLYTVARTTAAHMKYLSNVHAPGATLPPVGETSGRPLIVRVYFVPVCLAHPRGGRSASSLDLWHMAPSNMHAHSKLHAPRSPPSLHVSPSLILYCAVLPAASAYCLLRIRQSASNNPPTGPRLGSLAGSSSRKIGRRPARAHTSTRGSCQLWYCTVPTLRRAGLALGRAGLRREGDLVVEGLVVGPGTYCTSQFSGRLVVRENGR